MRRRTTADRDDAGKAVHAHPQQPSPVQRRNPKELFEEKGDAFFEAPIGSGPFVLDKWNKGQGMDLSANPPYWQEGKPSLSTAYLDATSST